MRVPRDEALREAQRVEVDNWRKQFKRRKAVRWQIADSLGLQRRADERAIYAALRPKPPAPSLAPRRAFCDEGDVTLIFHAARLVPAQSVKGKRTLQELDDDE